MNPAAAAPAPDARLGDLATIGFRPCRARGGYESDDMRLIVAAGWAVLEPKCSQVVSSPLHAHLGEPGLWRWLAERDLQRSHSVFEVPLAALRGGNAMRADDGGQNVFADVVAWARATRPGSVAPGRVAFGDWSPPPLETVRGWLPDDALTVRASGLARQGRLVHSRQRLAVEFPVAPCPDGLDAGRRAWLGRVLTDAQSRWRLARVGLVDGGIRAEIDLTGAPPPVLEALLPIAVDALRWVVAWVLEPVQFLVDVTHACADATLQPGWA